jgi:hypothetical protein
VAWSDSQSTVGVVKEFASISPILSAQISSFRPSFAKSVIHIWGVLAYEYNIGITGISPNSVVDYVEKMMPIDYGFLIQVAY